MITHSDRKGQKWFLKRSVTKAGNQRYTASKDRTVGTNVSKMPEGYEFNENVNAQVFVRKKRVSKILPKELALVEEAVAGLETTCRVEAKMKEIVVYTSDFHDGPKDMIDQLLRSFGDPMVDTLLKKNAHFSPMLRFVLEDVKERIFRTERMCFIGGDPDWMMISDLGVLGAQIKEFIQLLDDLDAFYETL